MEQIRNFFKDDSGASAVEYSLLVALIACACAAAVSSLGTVLINSFTNSTDTLSAATGGGS